MYIAPVVDHKPGQVPCGKPVLYRRREEIGGFPVDFDKVWFHNASNIYLFDIAGELYRNCVRNASKE
jgi:hypothetical protein